MEWEMVRDDKYVLIYYSYPHKIYFWKDDDGDDIWVNVQVGVSLRGEDARRWVQIFAPTQFMEFLM